MGYGSIREYTGALKRELAGCDPVLIVDAMDDAEEHLSIMVEEMVGSGRARDRGKALNMAVKQYGHPREVARIYRAELEEPEKDRRGKVQPEGKKEVRGLLKSIFSVYSESRTYLVLLYLFLMFPLGIFYFTYIVTGISLGIGLVITVIGIPLLILFLISIVGIAWLHGRLTEVLLGVRMPKKRRKYSIEKHRYKGVRMVWERLKSILKDPRTYSSLLYLFLMFPLGIIYFTALLTFLAGGIYLMMAPLNLLFGYYFGFPAFGPLWFQFAAYIGEVALGLVVITWTLHLTRLFGKLHGMLSRALLLRR